jgi:hypothetical protein
MAPGLHAALREAARESGLSLNEYCARKLAAPLGGLGSVAEGGDTVLRAAELCGSGLVAVVAFGSWTRNELMDGSDVDVLIVVEDRVPLTRDLYRQWDATPVRWRGRPVDAHFAHLPEAGARVAGLWGEVALDGVVLFERGLSLSARLAAVRRDIAAGHIVRRVAHGQPYWVGAA